MFAAQLDDDLAPQHIDKLFTGVLYKFGFVVGRNDGEYRLDLSVGGYQKFPVIRSLNPQRSGLVVVN